MDVIYKSPFNSPEIVGVDCNRVTDCCNSVFGDDVECNYIMLSNGLLLASDANAYRKHSPLNFVLPIDPLSFDLYPIVGDAVFLRCDSSNTQVDGNMCIIDVTDEDLLDVHTLLCDLFLKRHPQTSLDESNPTTLSA